MLHTSLYQEVSVHVYEKRGSERVGRGKRREAIAELLRAGVARLEQFSSPWLLGVSPGAVEENSECLVFVSERVLGTLSTIIASQHGTREMGPIKIKKTNINWI